MVCRGVNFVCGNSCCAVTTSTVDTPLTVCLQGIIPLLIFFKNVLVDDI